MLYRWDEFALDCSGKLLMRAGRQVDVSRKVLLCISHLVEHHDRVLGYDELIHAIWGHDDVTNHQLSQIVLAARRTIGDDGQTQRCIRTMPGIGYRWVAPLREDAPESEPPVATSSPLPPAPPPSGSAPAASPSPTAAVETEPRTPATRGFRTASALSLCIVVLMVGPQRIEGLPNTIDIGGWASHPAPQAVPTDPIGSLRHALFVGRFEAVREGLATLPPDIADGMEASLIDIELDIRLGRFARAAEKLAAQKIRADAAADPIWQAQLLLMHSELNNRLQLSGAEILAPAHAAVELLESSGDRVPAAVLAEALWRRANGLNLSDRFVEAQHDLVRARDLYQRIGDDHRSTDVRASLARVHMRMGRLSEALDEMRTVADDFRRFEDRIREIFARNTMSKIQIELLRWEDALTSNERSMELLRGVPDSERRYPTLQLRALALTGTGRLREAAAMLEEADGMKSERRDYIIPAIHHLETGDPQAALDAAAQEFESTRIDTRSNLLLENKDGALLLWMTAAQRLVAQGKPMPPLSEAQLQRLNAPESGSARAARGRWLMIQGRDAEAETELRRALEDFGAQNQIYRMTLVAEPLIDALLRRGDAASARDLLVGLRARAPEHVDRDYRATLLQLRLALAQSDRTSTAMAYRKAVASGLERRPPDELLEAYRRFETQGAQAIPR